MSRTPEREQRVRDILTQVRIANPAMTFQAAIDHAERLEAHEDLARFRKEAFEQFGDASFAELTAAAELERNEEAVAGTAFMQEGWEQRQADNQLRHAARIEANEEAAKNRQAAIDTFGHTNGAKGLSVEAAWAKYPDSPPPSAD